MKKHKIVIINPNQFGYNNATFYYCKYLRDLFDITYVCWDHGQPKILMDDVDVRYISRSGNTLVRTWRFIKAACREMDSGKSLVFIKYFKAVSLALRLLRPGQKYVLDIRSGAVHHNSWIRRFEDMHLRFEAFLFKNLVVISSGLAEKLGIAHRAHSLPLGADVISSGVKDFDSLSFLYVGTLFNRNIETTIYGFKKFYEEYKDTITISYTIIGGGPSGEDIVLRDLVQDLGLEEVVHVVGVVPHDELRSWFDQANVGISFVPLTEYYDYQPVTKTFEYLLSGMPVLATNTSENRRVISEENGILIADSAEDLYCGMKKIFYKLDSFNSDKIRSSSLQYTWQGIVENNLKPYLLRIKDNK